MPRTNAPIPIVPAAAVASVALVGVLIALARPAPAAGVSAVALAWAGAWWFGVRGPGLRWARARRELIESGTLLAGRTMSSVPGTVEDVGVVARGAASLLASRGALLLSAEDEARRLRGVFNALMEPVLVTDGRGMVVEANRAAAEFFGLNMPGGSPPHIDELFTHLDVLELHRGAAMGIEGTTQIRVSRRGAWRVYEVEAGPVERGAGSGGGSGGGRGLVMLSLRDVTALASAERLRTDFVANASHEIRTPLSSIKGAAETLESAGDDAGIRSRLVGMITKNVMRLEELTRDLLDLSRLESPEAEVEYAEVSTGDLEADLRGLFAERCRARGLRLVFEDGEGLGVVRTDAKLLGLILRNLIENACKFAYEGTAVVVRVSRLAGPGGGVRWEVIDRGIGIPVDQQSRIFERFYQVDSARSGLGAPEHRGTGLGLSLVKHAARALGGTVRVESVWREGTRMIVDVPDRPGASAGPG